MNAYSMSILEDQNNAIECNWATGKNEEYKAKMKFYEVNVEIGRAILRSAGCDEKLPDATSEYGGGSEACYWYDCGEYIMVGITTSDFCWAIPIDADIPDIENYYEKPADER